LRTRLRFLGGLLLAFALPGCGGEETKLPAWLLKPEVPHGTNLEDVVQHNNLGVGHLEQHHYGEAAGEFEQVVRALPSWAEGHINLGIAALSLHEISRAQAELTQALALSPRHPYARFCLGLALKQEGKTEEALEQFAKVLEVDPDDADTHYNLGLLYARLGKHREAVASLRKTLALQPANASARFRLASSLLALGEKEEGNREMAAFQRVNATGQGVSMGLQYTEQGKYSLALTDYRALGLPPAPLAKSPVRFSEVPARESGIAFVHGGEGADPSPPRGGGATDADRVCSYGPGVAAADFDSDGDPDLFLPNCGADAKTHPSSLLRNDGSGTFTDVTRESGLADAGPMVAAVFGDYDNDGHPDLYLTGAAGNRLYHNEGGGGFKEVTAAAGVAGSGGSLGAAWADADHDGDLDLIVARPGADSAGGPSPIPILFFNNNGNGSFTEVAAEKRVNQPLRALGVTFGDLDDDRDVDFIVSTLAGPVSVFSNDRIGTFTRMGDRVGLPSEGNGDGATLVDLDGDGWVDVYLPTQGWFRNREGKGFEARPGLRPLPGALGAVALDSDNDGDLDLLAVGRNTLVLIRNDGGGHFHEATSEAGLDRVSPGQARGAAAADFDGDGDADLLVGRNGAAPLFLRNDGGNLNPWLKIRLTGLHSNRSGVGTKVEVHAGFRSQRREVRLGGGYLSEEPSTLLFGLGDRNLVDFVRLIWPLGVLQSELEVSAGKVLEATELDRKGSSCPVLFAWDGRSFRFITDFLGVGGLGFLERPGVYGQPDPDEYVKIEAAQLKERDGYYLIQVIENLEEISYLDEAKLWVVDHPSEEVVFPNERFGGGGPPPFALFSSRRPILPVRARDEQDRDVLSAVLKIDRTYPDRFPVLERLPGFAETHSLTLDFGDAVKGKGNLVLFLYGWIDYGYSSTNLAASQAGIEVEPPRLETVGPEGTWVTLVEDMGFPAGMPRMMTVDLRGHGPLSDGRLRITTNMRIYWDQIYLAEVEPDPTLKITKLPAAYADLHARGYPREHSPDGKQPLIYDYNLMDRSFPFRNMAGDYTRFGPVTELLQDADDRFVILGRGEEVTLKFSARRLPALPRGWKRDFILYSNGYCKDMDPNTAYPDTVEPLPFHSMSAYPYPETEHYPDDPSHLEYIKRYNTRHVSGRP